MGSLTFARQPPLPPCDHRRQLPAIRHGDRRHKVHHGGHGRCRRHLSTPYGPSRRCRVAGQGTAGARGLQPHPLPPTHL